MGGLEGMPWGTFVKDVSAERFHKLGCFYPQGALGREQVPGRRTSGGWEGELCPLRPIEQALEACPKGAAHLL